MPRRELDPNAVLFEFKRIGAYQKVIAMDPQTLTEVFVQGPYNASQHDMQKLALAKLQRTLLAQNVEKTK